MRSNWWWAGQGGRSWLALVLAIVLAGCASGSSYQKAREHSDADDWDQAVYYYSKALASQPQNIEYRKSLEHAKVRASQQHAELAKNYMAAGAIDLAIAEYRVAGNLDPTNRFVSDSLDNAIERKKELDAEPAEKTELERLKEEARASGVPAVLQPASEVPLTLNFPPNTKVKDIYTALGKASGINFLFDSAIRDQDTFAIDIANISFKKALDQVAIANRHFYKVIDEHTLMVIPDNPQKRRDYEDNVIRTFYLSNANPNDVVNTLRGLLDARRLAVNPQLNAITIRDTPSKIAVMERIIESNDKPPSEVVIDVEIVEVRKASTLSIGTGLSEYRVTEVLEQNDEVNGVKGLRLSSLPYINSSSWLLTFPSLAYEARKANGNIKTLARPSLRALDGKQVTLRLGDQVPIETSTFSATTGGTVPLTRNFQFRDIGTNIDITPRVHHNNEVTLQLQVELTNIGDDPDGPAGPIPPTFGNRRINTEIRLKDGETNLLAGLFQSSDTTGREGLPIISDIPILRTLFARNSSESRETDIVLTLTPHIVRTPNIRKGDLDAFYVGTEANIGGVGDVGLGGAFSGGSTPFTPPTGAEETPADPAQPQPPGARPTPRRPNIPQRPGQGGAPTPVPGPGQPSFVFPEGAPRPVPTPPPLPGQPNENQDEQTPTRSVPENGATGPGPALLPEPDFAPAPAISSSGPARQRAQQADDGESADAAEEAQSEPGAPADSAMPPAGPESAAPSIVALLPSESVVEVGRELTVDVHVRDAEDIGHAPFWVSWNPAVLSYRSAQEGGFLRSEGAGTEFYVSPRSESQVAVGVSRLGNGRGAWGSGVLATLRFRAIGSGSTTIQFESASLRNPAGAPVPVSFVATTVSVP